MMSIEHGASANIEFRATKMNERNNELFRIGFEPFERITRSSQLSSIEI